jgi:hypothetical protein
MSLAIATVSGIAVQNPAFAEEYRGTFAQQLACTPTFSGFAAIRYRTPIGSWRACGRIQALLSGDCRAVFESNASAPPEAAPGRRNDRPRSYSSQ